MTRAARAGTARPTARCHAPSRRSVLKTMKIFNRHERLIAAPPEQLAALVADFALSWPAEFAPAPQPRGDRRYDAGLMVWEEYDRVGSARAFRVVSPPEIQAGHWFELVPAAGGTVLRHTIYGTVTGAYETIWRERIEPRHDQVLEALLDTVQAGVNAR
jgi:hypothetical protein